jgi:GDP-L-fucose synthase
MKTISKEDTIFVAGARGMVGSALIRRLKLAGYKNILAPFRYELDLSDTNAVAHYLKENNPNYIYIAAAKVGGIQANNLYRADFLYENLLIQNNLINGAHKAGVQRLMFLGSSCIYPKLAQQPIKESYLLTGNLEHTNEPYAIAKIAGVKMCEAYSIQYGREYISVMPTNLYGPNDNYDLISSHVLPAIIRKVHEAKMANLSEVVVWGSGKPKREFLYVDDLADACVFLMEKNYAGSLINIGSGIDVTISELTELVMKVINFSGTIKFDDSKPDGTPRKLLDVTKLSKLGWNANIGLQEGIKMSYAAALQNDWYI